MQLLIKLYSDKPSRIAIQYPYEYQAQRAYEAIVANHPKQAFIAKFELIQHKMTLTLQSSETGVKIVYVGLEYKAEQLKRLKDFFQKNTELIFVHVYAKSNILYVARPFRQKVFVPICELSFLSQVDPFY
jgi:hypothetical protein